MSCTGQITVSSDGASILQALHVEHPIGQVIVKLVQEHSDNTGDGATALLILIAECIRQVGGDALR